ncbi:MAG: NAD(P)-dependent oxidoreductase [Actinomycetota bacterium]
MTARVLVDPSFRRMDEIFTPAARRRLHDLADVVWGLDEPMPANRFLAEVATADAVVFGEWRHGRAALDAGTRLRAVLEVSGGHEHPGLDYTEVLRRGLLAGSCAPAFGDIVAEMALSLALTCVRGVAEADRDMAGSRERWLHDGNSTNTSLLQATVGFIGCGGISRSLQHLVTPFGVEILGYDPPIPDEVLTARGVTPTSPENVFDDADVIFVLAAPTPDNRGLVSAELMERLRTSQTLVVVSRAHLVDFDALTRLVSQRRFKAGIDVFPTEPLPADHPIRGAEWAVCVPHLAGALPTALTLIGDMVVDDLASILAGEPPTRLQYLDRGNAAGLLQV